MPTTEVIQASDIGAPVERRTTLCAHCGLPAPGATESLAFCCSACRVAHEVIRSCGLDRYYDLAKIASRDASPAQGVGRSYRELDDDAFLAKHARRRSNGVMEATLAARGIHCGACVWLLERLPRCTEGLVEVRVSAPTGRVTIAWDPAMSSLSAIARRVDSLGYALRPVDPTRTRPALDRAALVRIGVAGAIAGNVMLLSIALYAGESTGMEPAFERLFRWAAFALAAAALLWPGRVFLKSALTAIRVRAAHIDIPIALGLTVGLVAGGVNTFTNAGDVYFDTVAMLVFLLLVGRWIQEAQQRRSAEALELFHSIASPVARRVEGDQVRDVPLDALRVGDELEIAPGGTAPADGVVLAGRSHVDLSVLSGEAAPVAIGPGDRVAAGATNLSAPLRVIAEQTGAETRLGRLMELISSASERKAPIIRIADRVAGRFVVVVIVAALVTLAAWSVIEPAHAVSSATALLIVTCPCALALATPLAVMVSIRRAAARGILIKGGDTLEALAHPGTLVLDKTGTITEGWGRVVAWEGDETLRPLVAALERGAAQPIARALASMAESTSANVERVEHVAGAGVSGRVDGREIAAGSARFIEARLGTLPAWAQRATERMAGEQLTPVLIEADGDVRAVAGVGDALRAGSREAIATLRAMGWRVMICSGDRAEVVREAARAIGVDDADALGERTPEGKLELVRALAREGRVVMVGDGVNDAAALAEATVGVAVHGGAEASMHAADVYLTRPGLDPLVELAQGARRTMRVIRVNLGVSLFYNLICASLAVTALLSPLVAAILMPISSATVLTMSRSMRTFGGRKR